jgi:hypothetical protein
MRNEDALVILIESEDDSVNCAHKFDICTFVLYRDLAVDIIFRLRYKSRIVRESEPHEY